MAFPVVESQATSSAEFADSHTVTMPSGIQSGDLLLCFVNIDSDDTITFSGWTEVRTQVFGTSRTSLYKRTADGTEGATQSFTTGSSEDSAHVTMRISGHSSASVESSVATIDDTSINVPSLSPSWGSADTLWIACLGIDSPEAITAYPTSYTNTTYENTGTSSSDAGIAVARRENATATESGGSFTVDSTFGEEMVSFRVAVEPDVNNPPTVAQNTADAASFSTSTPKVEFTGTDSDGDDVRYNIELTDVIGGAGGYFTDFSEYTTSSTPSDWSRYWNTSPTAPVVKEDAGYTGGKYLEYTEDSGFSRTALAWENVSFPSDADVEMYFLFDVKTSAIPLPALRASETAEGSRTGYIFLLRNNTDVIDIRRAVSGSESSLGTQVFTFTDNTKYHVRIRTITNGSQVDVKCKVWADGGSEPGSWTLEVSDTNAARITAAGRVQLGTTGDSGVAYWVDKVGVAFGGDSAPTSEPSSVNIDAVSGTDAGFANEDTPADTDPFNSGDKASYTVQAGDALSDGTYHWRVRAIDPSGSNTYGSFSSWREFTVASAEEYTIQKSAEYTVATTTTIQKSGEYTVATTDTIQKSGEYAVATTDTIQKGGEYAVAADVTIQKGAQYTVPSESTIQTGAEYSVATTGTIQKSAEYVVAQSGTIQKSAEYTVATTDTIQSSSEYAVATTDTIQTGAEYAVATTDTIEKSGEYAVAASQTIETPAAYAVPSDQTIETPASYTVQSDATIQTGGEYAVATTDTVQKSAEYAVAADQMIEKSASYTVPSEQTIQASGEYTIALTDTLETAAEYAVVTETTIQKGAEYVVSAAAGEGVIQKGAEYTVATDGTIQTPASYKVATEQTLQAGGEYSVATTDTLQKDGEYAVVTQSLIQTPAAYAIETDATIQASAEYAIATTDTIQKAGQYRVAPNYSIETPATYAVVTSQTIATPASYAVGQPYAPDPIIVTIPSLLTEVVTSVPVQAVTVDTPTENAIIKTITTQAVEVNAISAITVKVRFL